MTGSNFDVRAAAAIQTEFIDLSAVVLRISIIKLLPVSAIIILGGSVEKYS